LDAVTGRIDIRYATTIEAVRDVGPRVVVKLSDGELETGDLLVGADGIHSRTRSLVFGDDAAHVRYLGYHTSSYLLHDPGLAKEVGDRFLMVAAPDRQVGLYPTGDGRIATWLVHRSPTRDLPARPRDTIHDVYGTGMGDLVSRALAHCPDGNGLYYDQVAQIEMSNWSRDSATLVGDACQAVSLMAGQGASLAVAGAYVLADELRRTPAVPAAITAYQKRMQPLAVATQRAGRRTARWLLPSSHWAINIRAAAFAALRLPGVAALLRPAFRTWQRSVI
jgi:2-polyprenyl-6-methoxyphenol hydroxylase-like FAD-dependent oxidoreductase